jgi:hypothetical protein
MSKILGYVIAAIGLIIAIVSFNASRIAFLSAIPQKYILMAGIVIIIVGVALTMMKSSSSSKAKQAEEEVPIYEGTGKKRKIVGYRKAE